MALQPSGVNNQITRLYLLRHAQTADVSKFHGAESDIGLSEWGHEQSRRVAKRFIRLPIAAVYCSEMKRAVDTARPIAQELGLVPRQVQALHERKMGNLAGACRNEFRQVYLDAMLAWASGDIDYTHESGESFRMMQDRGVPALVQILNENRNKSIVVVSHGMLIRVLLASLVPTLSFKNLDEIKIDNVAINELVWNGSTLEAVGLYDLPDDLRNPPDDKPFW